MPIVDSFGHQRERAVEPTTGRLTTLEEGKGRPLHRRREGQVERTGEAEREREVGVDHVALGPRFAFVGAGGGVSVLGGARAT